MAWCFGSADITESKPRRSRIGWISARTETCSLRGRWGYVGNAGLVSCNGFGTWRFDRSVPSVASTPEVFGRWILTLTRRQGSLENILRRWQCNFRTEYSTDHEYACLALGRFGPIHQSQSCIYLGRGRIFPLCSRIERVARPRIWTNGCIVGLDHLRNLRVSAFNCDPK